MSGTGYHVTGGIIVMDAKKRFWLTLLVAVTTPLWCIPVLVGYPLWALAADVVATIEGMRRGR